MAVQEFLRAFVEDIEATGQPVFKETEIYSNIACQLALPLNTVVLKVGKVHTGIGKVPCFLCK